MRREILVTGAGGFVGKRLAKRLTDLGYRVSGLDRRADTLGVYAEFARCDLSDDASVARTAFSRRFDAIVHLAGALPSQSSRGAMFATNTGATSAVLRHFAHPESHLVLFSTGLVYGSQPGPYVEDMECRPSDPYAESKWAAENLMRLWARVNGGRVTVLRPSVIYGSGSHSNMLVGSLLKALRDGKPAPLTLGEQLRDLLHVDDAVQAVGLVIEKGACGTFNLASGTSYRVREVAELIGRVSGRGELLEIGALPYRSSEIFDYRLDVQSLRSAVGFIPAHTLETGITEAWRSLS